MDKKSHLKKVSAWIYAVLIAFSAWGQEYVTKSGTPVFPADRFPVDFSMPAKATVPAEHTAGVYTIVVTPDLLPSLQPFVKWKRQQGYRVEILCISTPYRDSIRASLIQRYSPSSTPRYVLLAGDVDRIPSFWGKNRPGGLENHVTDLYYGEYTGDYLPEAYVGRLSASDSTEMSQIIAKTIAYEQGVWAADYNQILLIAGHENRDPAPLTTNGQVHYLSQLTARYRPGTDTTCFYNPESGSGIDSIIAALERGNLLVNYTAHCLSNGWSNPSINSRTFDTLFNPIPSIFVNNCCLSNAFNGTCFGETLLRRPQGGAVAVIGATNETLWNEDYYWAVGAKRPPSSFPLYDSLKPGAFDTLIAYPDEEYTLGAMLYAGCKSVSQSGSPFDAFYWETYTLLGDPSIIPFWTHADTLSLTPPDNLLAGSTTLNLHCNNQCRISITQDTDLLATTQSSSDGNATLTLPNALHGDSVTITAFRPETVCDILTLPIRRPEQPFLAAIQHQLDDTVLTVCIENVGTLSAHKHHIHLMQDSSDRSAGATLHHSSSYTIHQVDPQSDTTVSLSLGHLSLGMEPYLNAKLILSDSLGNPYSTLQLHIALPDRYPRLTQLRLLEPDSLPAHQLLANHDYIVQTILSCPADSLSIVIFDQHMATPPLSPLTYTSHFHTPTDLQHLPISVTTHLDNWHNTYSYWLTAYHTTEAFETGDFTNLPWLNTSTNPWMIDSTASSNGRYCARSAPIDNSQKSSLSLDIDVMVDDTISFRYNISSEASDWLYFYIDNRRTGFWSGNSDWKKYSCPVSAGRHRLQWTYQKDASVSELDDCARIDDIRLPLALWTMPCGTPDDDNPLIIPQPSIPSHSPLTIHPNPASNAVTICFPSSPQNRILLIYDTYGRLTDKKNIPSCTTSAQYSTTQLRLGTYTLVLQTDTGAYTKKMIVIR